MKGIISWNGQRSDQFGITIENFPSYTKPERKRDIFSVPGRNGDIILMHDAWENVLQKYEIFAGNGKRGAVSGGFSRVADWLYGPSGYCELWDDFDPDHYREAYFAGPFDVVPSLVGRTGRATISFNCKPQRFLMIGKEPVKFTETGVIHNPTAYSAKPLINIKGGPLVTNLTTLQIWNRTITLTAFPSSGELVIDCENMECYDGDGNRANNYVSITSNEFPTLKPGDNNVRIRGDITEVTITPRWFEI